MFDFVRLRKTGKNFNTYIYMYGVDGETWTYTLGHIRFAGVEDVVKLNWLPVNKNVELNILKLVHKSLYDETFPEYLKLIYTRSVLVA